MLVSFVVPSRDSQTWLPHAVESVLSQTHKEIELVIVNDGSRDNTEQYLKWLSDKNDSRIVVVRTTGVGRSMARDLGVKKSTGELILVLDADDLATPHRAALTVRKHKETGADFIYGGATMIDAAGSNLGTIATDVVKKDAALKTFLNGIVHSTVAYTRKFYEKYPYADGDIAKLGIDDWHQQIRAILDGVKMEYIPTPICAYRRLVSGISNTRDQGKVLEAKKVAMESLLAAV